MGQDLGGRQKTVAQIVRSLGYSLFDIDMYCGRETIDTWMGDLQLRTSCKDSGSAGRNNNLANANSEGKGRR